MNKISEIENIQKRLSDKTVTVSDCMKLNEMVEALDLKKKNFVLENVLKIILEEDSVKSLKARVFGTMDGIIQHLKKEDATKNNKNKGEPEAKPNTNIVGVSFDQMQKLIPELKKFKGTTISVHNTARVIAIIMDNSEKINMKFIQMITVHRDNYFLMKKP